MLVTVTMHLVFLFVIVRGAFSSAERRTRLTQGARKLEAAPV